MSVVTSLSPSTQQRLRLLALLWVGRVILLWFVLYPVYRPLSVSPLLGSTATDRTLLARGGENLLAFLDAQASSFADLSTAFCFLSVVAAALALIVSSTAWVAITEQRTRVDVQLCRHAIEVLPGFVVLGVSLLVLAAGLLASWLALLPVVGAVLVPWLGERRTDIVQLSLILGLVGLLSVLFVLADVVRAGLVVAPKAPVQAVRVALRSYRDHAGRVTIEAFARFGLSLFLHLLNGWLIVKNGWLTASSLHCALALMTTECAALSAIWLRLGWIDSIGRLLSTEATLSTRSRR